MSMPRVCLARGKDRKRSKTISRRAKSDVLLGDEERALSLYLDDIVFCLQPMLAYSLQLL